MTREEALDLFEYEFDGEETWIIDTTEYTLIENINKIFDSLEARIVELEARIAELEAPKSCQLCRYWTDSSLQHCTYHDIDTTNIYHYCDGCVDYEPKDSK